MYYPVSELKNQIILTINTLPDRIPGWTDKEMKSFITESVQDFKNEYRQRVEEAWNLLELFRNRKVIALVGNVNAGKSSLGNLLMGKGESEVFAENDIRETAHAKIVDWNNETLIDLPGLGSVLSSEDDQLVEKYVTRADLLIIVQSLTNDIDPVLYGFLKKVVSGNEKNGQRIMLVLNKTDNFSPAALDRTLQRYTEFFMNGSPAQNFKGIKELFSYAIPVVPFSVEMARMGQYPEQQLRDTVKESVNLTGGSSDLKFWTEMKVVRNNLAAVLRRRDQLLDAAATCKGRLDEQWQKCWAEFNRENMLKLHISQVNSILNQHTEGMMSAMRYLPGPNLVEKGTRFITGNSNGYERKKDAFRDKYSDAVSAMTSDFKQSVENYAKASSNTIHLYFREAENPDAAKVSKTLLDAYIAKADLVKSYYFGEHFDWDKIKNYAVLLSRQTTAINAGFQTTLNTYQEEIKRVANDGYSKAMREYYLLMEKADVLLACSQIFANVNAIINKTENPQPIHTTPVVVPQKKSSGLAIFLVILIVVIIIIIIIANSH